MTALNVRAVSGSADGVLRLWNWSDGQLLQQQMMRGHTDTVSAVAVVVNERVIVSGSWDRTVRVWRIP